LGDGAHDLASVHIAEGVDEIVVGDREGLVDGVGWGVDDSVAFEARSTRINDEVLVGDGDACAGHRTRDGDALTGDVRDKVVDDQGVDGGLGRDGGKGGGEIREVEVAWINHVLMEGDGCGRGGREKNGGDGVELDLGSWGGAHFSSFFGGAGASKGAASRANGIRLRSEMESLLKDSRSFFDFLRAEAVYLW